MMPNITDQHKDAVSVDRDDYTFMFVLMILDDVVHGKSHSTSYGRQELVLHFAYEIREVCKLIQLMSKPWFDFSVHAATPHKAQTWAKVTKRNVWLVSKV